MRKVTSFLLLICIMLSLAVTSFAESDPTALKPGDIIALGTYEQDNNAANGPEPIEWQVLDVDGDEAFLVSLHSLDGKKFNETRKVQLSWPESDIRAWLNGDFMGSAFTEDEIAALVTVNTEPDSETKDLVFLLSEEELKQYFPKEEERICEPTEYAYVQQGKRDIMIEFRSSLSLSESAPVIHDFTPADYPKTYFLRTVAPTLQYVYSVTNTGYRNPTERDTELCFVRPAIKISISTWAADSDVNKGLDFTIVYGTKASASGGNKGTDIADDLNPVTESYLVGYWTSKNGMHTFEMKKNGSFVTTVPVVPKCGNTYNMVDGVMYSYYASNPSKKTKNLKFTAISDTEVKVYSYQTKATYTLYKRR